MFFQDLQSEGLDVTCALVIVDREQGGKTNLAEKGIKMRSLCTLSQVCDYMYVFYCGMKEYHSPPLIVLP